MLIRIPKCISTLSTCLLAVLLVALCAASGYAQTLKAQLTTRAMSRDDIAAYSLPATTELTGGLTTVGLGQPAFLEAEVDITVPPSQISSVTWTLASKPANSTRCSSIARSPPTSRFTLRPTLWRTRSPAASCYAPTSPEFTMYRRR